MQNSQLLGKKSYTEALAMDPLCDFRPAPFSIVSPTSAIGLASVLAYRMPHLGHM